MMDAIPVTPPAPVHAGRRRSRLWLVLGAGLGIGVGLYAYQYVTRGAFWQPAFEAYVSERAGRPVRVAGGFELYLDPGIRFRAEGLSVDNTAWAGPEPFFAARTIALDASLWQALFGELTINDLVVDGGRLALQRRADKANNWTFGDKPLEIPDIVRAAVTDSSIVFVDAPTATRLDLKVGDIAGAQARGRQQIAGPLRFAGTGVVAGSPLTLDGSLTTPAETVAGGRVGIDLIAGLANTRIAIKGVLPGATRIDGADLAVSVDGRNLQEPGRLFGIILPATRPYRLAGNLTKTGRQFRFTNLAGRIGSSDMAGTLTVTLRGSDTARSLIEGTLTSKILDIKDVGPLVGYDPARLEAGKALVSPVGGRPRLLPDAPLATAALGRFDARIAYSATAVRTGQLPFDNLRLDMKLDDRLLTLAPLAFEIAGGRLTANVGIDARNLPVRTDYDVRLTEIPLGKLLSGFDVEDAGTTASVRGRLQLTGVGDTVHKSLASANGRIALVVPTGQLWIRNIELAKLDVQNFLFALLGRKLKDKRRINCGIVAFTVTDGRAVADPIIIDTDRAVFRGGGGFNFADETLRMSLEGDSKSFSLFSSQSPIAITGYFADPSINPISPELLARAAAALTLGIVASPFAAIAAFVDIGDAKDADCARILRARPGTAQDRARNAAAMR